MLRSGASLRDLRNYSHGGAAEEETEFEPRFKTAREIIIYGRDERCIWDTKTRGGYFCIGERCFPVSAIENPPPPISIPCSRRPDELHPPGVPFVPNAEFYRSAEFVKSESRFIR